MAFLQHSPSKPQPVYVLHGDEEFLKRQVQLALRKHLLGEDGDSFALSTYPGDKAVYATVLEDLETLPFLSPWRLVIIDRADPFVTKHRAALESYVAKPATKGVLVLDVKTWPSNTRLAKLLDAKATIVCKALTSHQLPAWCIARASTPYGKTLVSEAARLLVDLVGAEMGQLDQEIAKLASFVGDAQRIDSKAVDQLVGNSREENTFKIFDAIGGGRTGEALALLARLFEQGEDPMRMLGAFSLQLRRLAQATALSGQGMPLGRALEQAGVPPFAVRGCEQQLRHLGRPRAERLYDWLLETDQGLKGGSLLPPRTILERLVVRLARRVAAIPT
ncbi:MAG TPA: DNA polymerase III subunit delta [Gemmataceae bacterium]|nr:DNA polymerase III subunit delta [Gemmataceae bacterium]